MFFFIILLSLQKSLMYSHNFPLNTFENSININSKCFDIFRTLWKCFCFLLVEVFSVIFVIFFPCSLSIATTNTKQSKIFINYKREYADNAIASCEYNFIVSVWRSFKCLCMCGWVCVFVWQHVLWVTHPDILINYKVLLLCPWKRSS